MEALVQDMEIRLKQPLFRSLNKQALDEIWTAAWLSGRDKASLWSYVLLGEIDNSSTAIISYCGLELLGELSSCIAFPAS
ncbi:MAG: hypothetical protein BGP09_25645 [Rhizobium sp. 60-20]|nr:MAG: hypothetical protein BGP09_25645 [Rhizobium sp. 60-20]